LTVDSPAPRFPLLAIETRRAGIEIAARFSIDEEPVAEDSDCFEPVMLAHGDLRVEVRSTPLAQVTGCVLLRDDGAEIPFTPPPGSHAARLDALARDHPVLYASRPSWSHSSSSASSSACLGS
jgi:hypothetical protein